MPLAQLLPGQVLPVSLATLPVTGLCLDSRHLSPGDLFLAVPGGSADGREFIDGALRAGAVAVLAEADGLDCRDERVVPVSGLAGKISQIAGLFYGEPSEHLQITGVTGTNGKTTCSQLLAQLFSLAGSSAAVIGTLGHGLCRNGRTELSETGMTTPDAVTVQALLADYVGAGVSHLAMEVSSHSLDQARVADVHFTTAVFTNLSRDHLDYHGDLLSYAEAKMQLFAMPGLQHAVINVDDPIGAEIASRLSPNVELYGYSLNNRGAQVTAEQVLLSEEGISAHLQTPWGEGELRSRLLGRFNLENLLAVVAVACAQGMALSAVLELLPRLQPVAGRMDVVAGDVAPSVVVDYAHTPDALEKALTTLREHCRGQLWCVFGCGGDRDRGKRPLMGEIASRLADRVVVTSDNPRSEEPEGILRDILKGVDSAAAVDVLADRGEAIRYAVGEADEGDMVLIAGKGHEEYQLIGSQRLAFSDRNEARLALRQRGGRQ
ncbi:MAG: UDP-N-acetylmuramoyl-L-alanyl-D-glutamate--2,6-diaminopimelate ligase [Gammaproteobacteria bacterium]|nr:MAG: UDP-N-acetylmuramoyl-L-alanyl-D-glutamate--2,6-diaminopimelate ligase [Gammaproteobacteria bacterium]